MLAANFPLNIGVTLSNKAFFQTLSFRLPVTLACIHMLMGSVLAWGWLRVGLSDEKAPVGRDRVRAQREWILAFIWALHIAMSNVGLQSVSVHLFVLVKCAGPAASAVLSWLVLGRTLSARAIGALALLVVGPALAVHSELDVTWFGVLSTVAVVFLTSGKVVLSTLLFSGKQKWESLPLLAAMSPKACILLLPWAGFEIYSHHAGEQIAHLSNWIMFLLFCSGLAAFALNFNNFRIFKYLDSPVAVAVFTNMRKVLTIAVSIWVFDRQVGWYNMVGILVTFAGVFIFTMQELEANKRQQMLKKSKLDMIV